MIMSNLTDIMMRLSEYYSDEEIEAWLHARHPQLNDLHPIDLVDNGRSDEVRVVLNRLHTDPYL